MTKDVELVVPQAPRLNQIPSYNRWSKPIRDISDSSQQAALATTHMPSQNRSQKRVAHIKEHLASTEKLKDILRSKTSKEHRLIELP
jgi:hypothetical protein